MTQEQAKQVIETVSNDNIITLAGVSTGRRFQIIGAENTAEKFLALLTYMIDMPDPATGLPMAHNIRNVILNVDGFPIKQDGKQVLGTCSYPFQTIILNQSYHIDQCFADTAKKDVYGCFRHHLWLQLLLSVTHEVCHMAKYAEMVKAGKRKAIWEDHDEDAIEAQAMAALINMAKYIDLETPDLDEWHWFNSRIVTCEQAFEGGSEPWQALQAMMKGDNVVYMDTREGGCTFESIRDWLMSWDVTKAPWPETVEELILARDKEDNIPECTIESTEPTPEDLALLKAKEEEEKQAERDKRTEALKQNLILEFKAACGMSEEAEVDDATLAIFLMGKGIDINKLDELANPPEQTTATVNDDGSGVITVGSNDQAVFDTDDDFYSDGSMPAMDPMQMPGFGVPAQPSDPTAVYQQAIQQNMLQYSGAAVQPTLEAHGMAPELAKASVRKIYEVLINHIFVKCNWSQMQVQQAPGMQPIVMYQFAHVAGVSDPVCISLDMQGQPIPGVEKLVVDMTTGLQGQYRSGQPVIKDNQGRIWVKGHSTKDGSLPSYTLGINFGNGIHNKRGVMPQNPNKVKNGQLSKYAQEARLGNQRVYILDKTVRDGGILDVFVNGNWTK